MTILWNDTITCKYVSDDIYLTNSGSVDVVVTIVNIDLYSEDYASLEEFSPEFKNLHSKTVVEFNSNFGLSNAENIKLNAFSWIKEVFYKTPSISLQQVFLTCSSNNTFLIHCVLIVCTFYTVLELGKEVNLPHINTSGKHRKSSKKASNYGTSFCDVANEYCEVYWAE
ncbi:hypothetical protein ACF0H5_007420 [Mactra antiquata]